MNNGKRLLILTLMVVLTEVPCNTGSIPVLLPRPRECGKTRSASEQEVSDKFFRDFGSWQRPRTNASDPVDVSVTFVLSSINDVLEKDRIIKLTGYLSVRWHDDLRIWQNEFPYSCVDYLVIPASEIWTPDIAQMNGDGRYVLMNMPGEKVRIYKNGYAIYSPGGTFATFCQLNLAMFPFDSQVCTIQLESWRYTSQYMTLQFGGNVTIKYWTENEQWSLIGTKQSKVDLTYLDPQNKFDHIEFHVKIKRKISYYMMNVIIPSCLIAVAHLSAFSLPTDAVEKIGISFTCLLAYSVFQLMVDSDMPRSSDNIPLLSIYIDLQMSYIALSMLGEGICFLVLSYVHEKEGGRKYPGKRLYMLCTLIGAATCVAPIRGDMASDETDADSTPYCLHNVHNSIGSKADKIRKLKWHYIAKVVARLNFFLYLICIIVTPIIMFVIYPAINC